MTSATTRLTRHDTTRTDTAPRTPHTAAAAAAPPEHNIAWRRDETGRNRPWVRAVPCRAVPCRAVPCRAVPCRAVPPGHLLHAHALITIHSCAMERAAQPQPQPQPQRLPPAATLRCQESFRFGLIIVYDCVLQLHRLPDHAVLPRCRPGA